MSDGFTEMLVRAQAFYGELAQNNSKEWFEPRKAQWKQDIEGPAKLFADIMAEEISRLTGAAHKPKVFRIYRDVRFSKDKSPLKTMLAMLWSPAEAMPGAPSFYFGIEPDRTFVGCGTPGFDKDGLVRFRRLVDTKGDELLHIISESGARISDFGPEPLKRVPKPYDHDHPHADLLRRKALVLGTDLPSNWEATGEGLVAVLLDRIETFLPYRRFMVEGA